MTRPAEWSFEAIGTLWSIQTPAPLAGAARAAVAACIDAFDRTWSRFRRDSLVAQLAEAPASVPLPADAEAMLDLYADLDRATGGAVNPLVGDALAARGYDADYSFVDRGPRAAPAHWRGVLGWEEGMLRLAAPASIDVGALGKGRLVDLVLAAVRDAAGPPATLVVDAGGDLAVRGAPQRIGLEHPYDPRRAIGVMTLEGAALCASAVNRRTWGEGLHHVLDARTGVPVRAVAATWAIAPSAMLADAAATALFFDGGPEFAAERGVEWVRMTTGGAVEWSPGSTAEVFT